MYYHASQTAGLKLLEPRVSNHGVPLVYFSTKRENVLVYLSNAVEKYCRETGFSYDGPWKKWGPYGFDKDGRLRLEEYYPGALESTYRNVSAYIYSVSQIEPAELSIEIPDAAVTSSPVQVEHCEFVPDALEAILQAEREGLITILRYEELTENMLAWNERTARQEYAEAADHPEYRHFLLGNFPFLREDASTAL